VHHYSLDWASTVVEAYWQTCPRAADNAARFCHVTPEQVALLLANDGKAWEAFKAIAKNCRHFPNCDTMDYLGGAMVARQCVREGLAVSKYHPGNDLQRA